MENAKYSGVVLYKGPSNIDGQPIVCIATLKSDNSKTGDMVQTWILRSDIDPATAVKTGDDISICGLCEHRGTLGLNRSCYVNVGHAPLAVYKAYKRGNYPHIDHIAYDYQIFKNRSVRIGAYGDPAAVPIDIWRKIARHARAMTGYTHQWQQEHAQGLKKYCMASVDSFADLRHAKLLGWRTFRTSTTTDPIKREVLCPASEQAGKKLTCSTCLACNGTATNRKADIVIQVHGTRAKISAFNMRAPL